MKVEHITIKGVGKLNEDSIIINDEILIYGVADGVSSLTSFESKEEHTGGYIASNEVKSYFESLKTYNNFFDDLVKINQVIRDRMKEYEIDIVKKEQLWGTALAAIKVSDTGIDFIQTGDCMIIAVYKDNEVRPLTRLQVSHLESLAIVKWKELIEKGLKTREELIKEVKDILISNRKKSNTFNGYGVLNGELQASDYFEYGRINKIELKHLIILSDGMFLPIELIPVGIEYWDYVIDCILKKGIEKYSRDLIEMEEEDPECVMYPRLKKSDDKTGIIISF